MDMRRIAIALGLMMTLPTWPMPAAAALNQAPQACIIADQTCKESMAVGQYTFWYFRSYSLSTPNANITRAVIVTHGLDRNAADYFAAAVTALNNANDPTLVVIAPHFKGFVKNSPTCQDALETGELHWSCTGQGSVNRWDDGGQARDTGTDVIFSFTMIDMLIGKLSDPSIFPNLTQIAVSGHSDGGQFTQRYAAGNQLDGVGQSLVGTRAIVSAQALRAPMPQQTAKAVAPTIQPLPTKRAPITGSSGPRSAGVKAITASVQYVIANPGSYLYIDNQRLASGETCFQDGTCTAPFTPDWDPANVCSDTYNNYKYGLDARTYGYMNSSQPGFSDAEVAQRFTGRTVAYLMGEQDQLNNSQFDTSCEANAQGSHLAGDGSGLVGGRRDRGTLFWNYMRPLGATHTLTIVPGCGHEGVCMYSSTQMIQALLF